MQITCGICGHRGDAERFLPENVGMLPEDISAPDHNWVCPCCLCEILVPATLTADDLAALGGKDASA
jgi:hypothetical protein